MIKKFVDTIILLISSGAVFHRCTFIGALCAAMLLTGCGVDNADPTPPEEPDGTKTEELSPDTLRDAQAHPEKHRDLQIRVCGWNVLWNNLSPAEQAFYIRQAEAAQ